MSLGRTWLLVLCAGCAWGQPVVNGVFNSASYAPFGMPNWGIAQGSLFTLFGSGVGPAQLVQSSGFPLQTSLAGTAMHVTAGAITVDAYPLYTSATQIAAVLPSETPVGEALVTVTYQGQTSNSKSIVVVKGTFGIFTLNQAGSGPAVVQNFNSQLDQPVNTLLEAAHPGQVVTLWGPGSGR
jgi:uncharacterized protein (TIGR03437 family)